MFRDNALIKPKKQSLSLTLVIALLVFSGSHVSVLVGYFSGVICLFVMILASLKNSFWPTRGKSENTIIFSLFWGIVLGALVPHVLEILISEGFSGLYDMLVS